ncbi:hypothetical protein GKZ89_13915 [Bacillus mangrovi]|uniref:Uncharacterized protein n=1 Tax=Metabacillus mangrovi TaxID=1491830 RepID=A0A7X2V5S3_9BACI|nr:hypothetical protein [Metabacillus mangrovi]MTH54496.1 hypothetical protein [Metabacillus mangrovi]
MDEQPFSFQIAKNQSVFLFFKGKQIKIMKGKEAEKLVSRLHAAKDEKEIQLLLAKATGNFKHGNERK